MSGSSTVVSSFPGLKLPTISTSTSTSGAGLPDFGPTLGAQLIGGLLALAFWGMACGQTYTYFADRPRDPVAFKATIASLWLLDTFGSALIIHILYYYMVINYMNVSGLAAIVWSDTVFGFPLFYLRENANRAFAGPHNRDYIVEFPHSSVVHMQDLPIEQEESMAHRTAPVIKVALSLLDLATGIVVTIKVFGVSSYYTIGDTVKYFYLDFAGEAASDVSVALTLSVLLYRSRTGLHKTDGLVRVLMFYVINTGMLGAVVAALGMIFYAIMPTTLIYLAPYYCLSKLYLSAYLAMLNARQGLREISGPRSIHLSELQYAQHDWQTSQGGTAENSAPEKSQGDPENVAISVHTLIDQKVEEEVGETLPTTRIQGVGRAF
ncbi:hypothetical protein APHAL10511_005204 [Amanita phalloides]|nr:hypothetical protein APHAL10511_005204 [Amanita phalloides]